MMQWIASIWAPDIYIFEFAQTEQDISNPCIMNVRQPSGTITTLKLQTPENVTSNKLLAI